jgi:hypothetical protein
MGAESGEPEEEIAADVYTYLHTSYGKERLSHFASHRFVGGLEMECAHFFPGNLPVNSR